MKTLDQKKKKKAKLSSERSRFIKIHNLLSARIDEEEKWKVKCDQIKWRAQKKKKNFKVEAKLQFEMTF